VHQLKVFNHIFLKFVKLKFFGKYSLSLDLFSYLFL